MSDGGSLESSIHSLRLYVGFVDDIFYVLSPSARINQLLNKFSLVHPNVKLVTMIESDTEIAFLDLLLSQLFGVQ